jgi:hypothetical protein
MLFEFGVDLRHVLVRQLCHRFNLGQHGKKGAQRASMNAQRPAARSDARWHAGVCKPRVQRTGEGSDTGCTHHDGEVASAPTRQEQLCAGVWQAADAAGRGGAVLGTSCAIVRLEFSECLSCLIATSLRRMGSWARYTDAVAPLPTHLPSSNGPTFLTIFARGPRRRLHH